MTWPNIEKKWPVMTAVLLGSVGLGLVIWMLIPTSTPDLPQQITGDPKRGAYLARLSGCVTCHTSKVGDPWAGGVALASDFGAFMSPNITPDPEFGIGGWTFQDFVGAVRHGIAPNGSIYYPAFPFEFYATLTDRDLADMWAAVQEVPPSNYVPADNEVPLPFSIRQGVKLWRTFFYEPVEYVVDETKSTSWNRGRFMVEGPAHCAACHTPRNFAGGLDTDAQFAGASGGTAGWTAPPITTETLEEAGWTKESLIAALRTGLTPTGDAFGGAMAEVVHLSTSYLMDQHIEDMAEFLMDQ